MYVNQGSIIAIGVIFPVLGTVAVASRFVTKIRNRAGLWVDDWLCIPALVFLLATGALMIFGGAVDAIGTHSPSIADPVGYLSIDPPKMSLLLELEWIISMMNPIGTGLIRLSFLFFYRRIFRGKIFDIVSWSLICLTIGYMISFTVAWLTVCGSSPWIFWESMLAIETKCFSTLKYIGVQGIISFILDLSVLSVPFFWIWQLQMAKSQKWAVTSVFLCGLFTVAASAMRMAAGILSITYRHDRLENFLGLVAYNDIKGCISIILFWHYIEHGTGLVVCCLPSLRPVLVSKSMLATMHNVSSWCASVVTLRSGKSRASSQASRDSLKEAKSAHSEIVVTQSYQLSTLEV